MRLAKAQKAPVRGAFCASDCVRKGGLRLIGDDGWVIVGIGHYCHS